VAATEIEISPYQFQTVANLIYSDIESTASNIDSEENDWQGRTLMHVHRYIHVCKNFDAFTYITYMCVRTLMHVHTLHTCV
jgi:hypothetical protein